MLRLVWIAAIAVLVAAAAAAAAPVAFKRDAVRDSARGTVVLIDVNPSALSSRDETPQTIAFALPRGMRFDRRARKRACRSDEAAAARCPRKTKVGFGHAVTNVSGYLFPGGETDAVATIKAFLGRPVRPGDLASLVLQVEPRGVDRLREVLRALGFAVPRRSSVTGRVVRVRSGPYGLEVRFDEMPGGLRVPEPLEARMTRLKLTVGAVRRVRKNFVRRVRVRTLEGSRIQRIRDHRLIGRHLLRRPRRCPGSWPYEIRAGFPSGEERATGRIRCRRR